MIKEPKKKTEKVINFECPRCLKRLSNILITETQRELCCGYQGVMADGNVRLWGRIHLNGRLLPHDWERLAHAEGETLE